MNTLTFNTESTNQVAAYNATPAYAGTTSTTIGYEGSASYQKYREATETVERLHNQEPPPSEKVLQAAVDNQETAFMIMKSESDNSPSFIEDHQHLLSEDELARLSSTTEEMSFGITEATTKSTGTGGGIQDHWKIIWDSAKNPVDRDLDALEKFEKFISDFYSMFLDKIAAATKAYTKDGKVDQTGVEMILTELKKGAQDLLTKYTGRDGMLAADFKTREEAQAWQEKRLGQTNPDCVVEITEGPLAGTFKVVIDTKELKEIKAALDTVEAQQKTNGGFLINAQHSAFTTKVDTLQKSVDTKSDKYAKVVSVNKEKLDKIGQQLGTMLANWGEQLAKLAEAIRGG